MVYSHSYYDHQQPTVPWPDGYDDSDPKRNRRNPAVTASLSGGVAVLVLAVGVLLGLQLTESGPDDKAPPSPTPTVVASAPNVPAPTVPREPVGRSSRPPADSTRLDRSTYDSLTAREFALMAKDPDAWAGRKVVVYGVITQFDSATGATSFRADTGPAPVMDVYDYDQNTIITARDADMVAKFVEKDRVTMYVEVQGSRTYETQIGGSTTVPSLTANIIDSTSRPASRPAPTYPTAQPDVETASGNQLRAIAASDKPMVLATLADTWVPQLSSKRLGLFAEGRTWTHAAILAEHQQLRQAYPGARLLWAGDWSTFSDSNFWVTVAGPTFPTAEGALAWCRSGGFDRDHCFAKLISTTRPVEGSTDYNE
ncbi:hypothetical protein [Mycobacterium sp. 852014-52144_SCH5372336]|uniref:hypothetical protein n=1 Tax=Mycobacterium sp. 852014-52144_SCH5372336 TaxID=1834115 RepID=UPI0007FDF28C|nr:hypothetical protein [Mycobacterium sp. 852014-52144_SCH5372336]OBB77097.1 hypothetical protein A5759_04500 [Mycobacterium sp. 852014-52144_SCH5372336]